MFEKDKEKAEKFAEDFVKDKYGNGVYKWHTPFCEACDYGDEVDDNEVIEWCEIPKNMEEL